MCTTFFTGAIYKDDMLAPENVSKKIEEERKSDPYYLCSHTIAMGSVFAEGNFLFLDTDHPEWKNAVSLLFKYVEKIKKEISASVVIFRDFEDNDILNKILQEEGYARLRMPNSNKIENPKWESNEDLLSLIDSKKKRRNIRLEAMRKEDLFDIRVKNSVSDEEARHYFDLFANIKDRNFAFNFFKYPDKIVSILSKYKEYEFIHISLKGEEKAICAVWSFVGDEHYCPLIMGLNYDYLQSHSIYKQAIFQIVKRGNQLNKKTVYLGFSADYEKQKYGAKGIPKHAFIRVDDTYNFELLESYSNINELAE